MTRRNLFQLLIAAPLMRVKGVLAPPRSRDIIPRATGKTITWFRYTSITPKIDPSIGVPWKVTYKDLPPEIMS